MGLVRPPQIVRSIPFLITVCSVISPAQAQYSGASGTADGLVDFTDTGASTKCSRGTVRGRMLIARTDQASLREEVVRREK